MNKNNFDGIRIGLALIVFFGHFSVLTQVAEFKIFESIFDSNFAIKGFFAISGFLVTKSYLTSNSLLEYAEKRFRRIYPAYLSSIFICLFIGVYATSLGFHEFITSSQTLKYFLSNAVFLNFIQPTLPFVFDGDPIQALDGSLWTIKVEVMLYFFIPPLIFLFTRLGLAKTTITFFLLSVLWVYFFLFVYSGNKGGEIALQFPGQLSYFIFGALFAINKKMLSKIKWIALASCIILFSISNVYAKLLIDPIAYSSIVIFLSTTACRSLNLGRYGDISYGIYLYHFPIIQFLIFLGLFKINVWVGFLSAFILTIAVAFASWHFVEKKLLKRTSHYVMATQN